MAYACLLSTNRDICNAHAVKRTEGLKMGRYSDLIALAANGWLTYNPILIKKSQEMLRVKFSPRVCFLRAILLYVLGERVEISIRKSTNH